MTPRRNITINVLLVVCSLLLSFGLLELFLRASDYPRREAKLLCLDPVVRNVFCPNVSALAPGTNVPITINKDGMADREYAYSKSPKTTRIALLGDSVTASIYTPLDRKFEQLWETALTQWTGQAVEVLNFAVDGTGTWEQLQLFHLRARNFQPDYVMLGFFWGNDVWNNLASLSRKRPNPLNDEYGASTFVTTVKVAHRNTVRWLWNHSAAFQLLDTLKTTVETQFDYKRAQQPVDVPGAAAAPPQAVDDPALAWDSDAWDLTRRLILKLKAESDAADARLVVFSLPMLDQITRSRALPYREFQAFLGAHGITHLDAFADLMRLTEEQKKALYMDGAHLTDEGHRFFAGATLPKLQALLASTPRAAMAGAAR